MRALHLQLGQFQPSGLPPALSKHGGKNTLQTEADALDLTRCGYLPRLRHDPPFSGCGQSWGKPVSQSTAPASIKTET